MLTLSATGYCSDNVLSGFYLTLPVPSLVCIFFYLEGGNLGMGYFLVYCLNMDMLLGNSVFEYLQTPYQIGMYLFGG